MQDVLGPDSASTPDFILLNELPARASRFCCTAGEELLRLEAALHEGMRNSINEAAHRAAAACFVVVGVHV